MEWFDYVLTAVIGAIFGALFGGLAGYFLEIWKDRREKERGRVNRILQPLRELQVRLSILEITYGNSDKDSYERFYSDFVQASKIIEDLYLKRGLDMDISKESKTLSLLMTELEMLYSVAKEKYENMRSQIRSDDVNSLNRLSDEYRMQLFKNQRIEYLIRHLRHELNKWIREHT